MKNTKVIKLGNIKIGGKNPFVFIAGPCVIESEKSTLYTAEQLKKITDSLKIPFVFKASYDKANRTSVDAYRGPGLDKGLQILKKVKKEIGLLITSDVHSEYEANVAGEVLDILQIPAFLSRQTDLLLAAAHTKKVVNVKKGQFLSPWEMGNVIKKLLSTGNKNIIVTDRGSSFGYNNLVSDFRSILIMKKFGYPVCYDATHSVQRPGGLGNATAGDSEFVPYLAAAALTCNADMIFMEVHKNPAKALSDGPNMIKLSNLKGILKKLQKIQGAI